MRIVDASLIFFATVCLMQAGQGVASEAPWTKPRKIEDFQALLDRSPFSLPTVEETAPADEKFTLTGAAKIGGETMVYVLDRTTQTRQVISRHPNQNNAVLIEYTPDPDPRKMKAKIQVGSQVSTITYSEPVPVGQPSNPAGGSVPGGPQMLPPGQQTMPSGPGMSSVPTPNSLSPGPTPPPAASKNPPAMPGSPAYQSASPSEPSRSLIRRRTIKGQPTK